MNHAQLLALGFELGDALGGRSQGAWRATTQDDQPVVLKWTPCETMAGRYATLLPALDNLRARGVPVPECVHVGLFESGTLSAQTFLPGAPDENPPRSVIDAVVDFIAAEAGIKGPPAPDNQSGWGAFVVHTLTVGRDESGMHAPLRNRDQRTAAVLERIKAVGADADPDWFISICTLTTS